VLGTTSTTPAPTEGSKPLPATTLASASVLKGSRVVATATGVSLELPAGWEAYSFGVLNALADAPPARVVAAADFADEAPTDYVRDRAADVEAIAVGPGRRPYSMTVAAVPLVDGKDADLAEVSKDKDAQIVTWRTGLGKAKVYAYDLGNAAVVTVEAHVRRGDHVIAITAVGPHLDTTVNLLRKALPSLRAL
jgi:hypothetical protein